MAGIATEPGIRAGVAPARWPTHVALFVVQVAFASGAVEGKLALMAVESGGEGVSPWALAMARMVSAAAVFQSMSLVARLRGGDTPAARWRWSDQARIAGLAVLGIVLNQALYLLGLQITSAFSAALLGATIPVFTASLAVLFRRERASARTGIGVLLALTGVLWLTGVEAVDRGAILVALNCLAYSLYLVLAKSVIERLGALTVITWVFTWAVLLFAPVGIKPLVEGALVWSPRGWALVGYIIAMPTIVAYLANAWALGRTTATVVTVYIYLQPVLTAVLNWLQLDQGLSVRMLTATALILIGVAVVTTRRVAPASR